MKIVWLGKHKDTIPGTWYNDVYNAIVEGFNTHGETVIQKKAKREPTKKILQEGFEEELNEKPFDLIIMRSHKGYSRSIVGPGGWGPFDKWCNTSTHYLVVEAGYYNNRRENVSMGYNGLNGEADFVNSNSDGKRWKHDRLIKPWRSEAEGEYVLIIKQTPHDATLVSKTEPPVDINTWVNKQKEKYLSLGYKVKIRPHPDTVKKPHNLPTLEEDFAKAKIVVTCSSNVGVLSVLQGIPTVATYPVSMVYNLCRGSKTPAREQWLKNLSYCQWSLQEISNGSAWEHLKKKYKT
jgi:hypothetical protein